MPASRSRTVVVHYPLSSGRLALRSDADWNTDLEPVARDDDGGRHEFVLPMAGEYSYFKPVIRDAGAALRWSIGNNYLTLAGVAKKLHIYPFFYAEGACSVCTLHNVQDPASGRQHSYRVFYPPGYAENTLARYPVLYMQDGQNLFFPDEAFGGQHWRIAETLARLTAMNVIAQVIVVGVYPHAREHDYTTPGYEDYGRCLVEIIKPAVDAEYRTLDGPENTAVMGSSLGGVASFYLAWQYPQVFGMASCMSSSFGWRDDLAARVASEPKRDAMIYLDSGWPGDNYENTRAMRANLLRRGYREGDDLHYYAFPDARHNEHDWALRAHLPFQLFFDRLRRNDLPENIPA